MAGYIKKIFPQCQVLFLGRAYTKDVVMLSEYIDVFVNYDEIEKLSEKEAILFLKNLNVDIIVHVFPVKKISRLARLAKIPTRVGTTNRLYHWFGCNNLIKLSRNKSNLHEAQLNLKLLKFLGVNTNVDLSDIPANYGFNKLPPLPAHLKDLIDPRKFNIILHPKSKGSAREWGIENFIKLISLMPEERYKIFISGTKQDGEKMAALLKNKSVNDITGKLSLSEFISFINASDGLVAASTGPLHIAAALGKKAIGLFVPKRPMHPGRWAPLGYKAQYVVFDPNCKNCANGKDCNCISEIDPKKIVDLLSHE